MTFTREVGPGWSGKRVVKYVCTICVWWREVSLPEEESLTHCPTCARPLDGETD